MARSYAIIWRRGRGPLYAGRLDLTPDTVWIEGSAPGRRTRIESIPFPEISSATVTRERAGRLRGLPTLTLELRRSAPIEIAALDAVGGLTELASKLTALIAGEPSAADAAQGAVARPARPTPTGRNA